MSTTLIPENKNGGQILIRRRSAVGVSGAMNVPSKLPRHRPDKMVAAWFTSLLCVALVLTTGAQADCDLTGDWVGFHFIDFDQQPASPIQVLQRGANVQAECQGVNCTFQTASGKLLNNALTLTTSAGTQIDGVVHQSCDIITTGIPQRDSSNWLRVNRNISKVHVVYMTHLDVGYTLDTSMEVLELYRSQWFPKAYATAAALPTKFRWTTHPWLVAELLHNATGTVTAQDIAQLQAHLASGALQYHAGPFNIQSEMYEPSLFTAGLEISRSLDKIAGRATPRIVLSQKDVPGMTRGAVPLLAAAGIKAIHIGVNDFSTPPAVPHTSPEYFGASSVFWWEDPATATRVLTYYASSYSEGSSVPEMAVTVPGFNEALVFLFHVDNTGPQDPAQVLAGWSATSMVYPNAQLVASTLDDFTTALLAGHATDNLPVVTAELGDTWIYGCSSDPARVRQLRVLSRLRAAAIANGAMDPADPRVENFSRNLVKLGEHTWGNNEGTLFYVNYTNAYFDQNYHTSAFQSPLSSFVDQRKYVDDAMQALDGHPLQSLFAKHLADSAPSLPNWSPYTPLSPANKPVSCGANMYVYVDNQGTLWLQVDGKATAIASMYYTTHSEQEFQDFIANYSLAYLRDEYINAGFGKYGLAACGGKHSETQATLNASAFRLVEEGCDLLFNLSLPRALQTGFGAPATIVLRVEAVRDGAGVQVALDLQWANKRSTRMAESLWLTLGPATTRGAWQLHKLGSWIDAHDVAINGSRNTHAIDEGVRLLTGPGGDVLVSITSIDAAVMATTERTPIRFSMDPDYINTSSGMHFSLFNNAWNTNYPVWSQDSADRFRFQMRFENKWWE
eukprot:m.39581 g.39581  ORF g.39581 m.39581 type:complete len:846 (-) comp10164_c0_seq1:126-2663(-)